MESQISPFFAELIGTFSLVFIGAGTAAMMKPDNQVAPLIVGVAFALILMIIIYAWGSISGANVNPVISIALALDNRITYTTMVIYWIAQFIGAILAGALLMFIFGKNSSLGSTIGSLTYDFPFKAVIVEAILTFFLVFVVLTVTADEDFKGDQGLSIGLTLGLGVLFGYNLTGGSLNPARSFGPALFSGNLNTIWIYFLGPFIGGVLAYLIYKVFYPTEVI